MTMGADDNPMTVTEIGHRLDRLPLGRIHRKVVLVVGLGLFLETYEIFLAATIGTTLKTRYHLDGTLAALVLVGRRRCRRLAPVHG
jgi:MFS transporter, putative metabolite:H+ symporter